MNPRWSPGVLANVAVVALAAGFGTEAGASSCRAVSSGYDIGPRVVFVTEDRSRQPTVRTELIVHGADPVTFEGLRRAVDEGDSCAARQIAYGRDRKGVFFHARRIPGADPGSYTFLDGNYARDRSAVFAFAKRLSPRVNEFRLLGGGYATDGRRYFFQDQVLEGRGFELLGDGSLGYARTAKRVYLKGRVIAAADPGSFDLFAPEVGITRDSRSIYQDHEAIQGADRATFEQIRGYTFKDRSAVYHQGRRLVGIDPATVRVSEFGTYLIDARSVYRAGERLAGRDAATFVELQPAWSRDSHNAYYRDAPIADVDLDTFKTTGLDRAEDRRYRYEGPHRACGFVPGDDLRLPLCK